MQTEIFKELAMIGKALKRIGSVLETGATVEGKRESNTDDPAPAEPTRRGKGKTAAKEKEETFDDIPMNGGEEVEQPAEVEMEAAAEGDGNPFDEAPADEPKIITPDQVKQANVAVKAFIEKKSKEKNRTVASARTMALDMLKKIGKSNEIRTLTPDGFSAYMKALK